MSSLLFTVLKRIFTLLSSKSASAFTPVNRLETLLADAVEHPERRFEFCRQLFHFDLWVIVRQNTEASEGDSDLRLAVAKGSSGLDSVYAFTSKEALESFLKLSSSGEQPFVALPALALFEQVKGRLGVFLNPGLPFGKEFTPEEIIQLLSDNLAGIQKRAIDANSSLQMDIPAQVPAGLVDTLSKFLPKLPVLEDIHFTLCIRNHTELSYLGVLKLRAGVSWNPEETFAEIGAALKSMRIDHPVDLTLSGTDLQRAFDAGAMISVRNAAAN